MEGCWNPWHGCHRYTEGCLHCYVYRRDESIGLDPGAIHRTKSFDLPMQRDRAGNYKLRGGQVVFTAMTSDFFVEEADAWRPEAFAMMKQREDLSFFIITKRVLRIGDCLPDDWGEGYPNVSVVCTVENQRRADERLPEFLKLPIRHKHIACEPLLEEIDLFRYLGPQICSLTAGGESGDGARICDYSWILSLCSQCRSAGVPFSFHQTGARLKKNGRIYEIPRRLQHSQAKRAGLDSGK